VPPEQAPACCSCGQGVKAAKTDRITQILPDGTEVLLAVTSSADDCCECACCWGTLKGLAGLLALMLDVDSRTDVASTCEQCVGAEFQHICPPGAVVKAVSAAKPSNALYGFWLKGVSTLCSDGTCQWARMNPPSAHTVQMGGSAVLVFSLTVHPSTTCSSMTTGVKWWDTNSGLTGSTH
jgi:hypothetical protein